MAKSPKKPGKRLTLKKKAIKDLPLKKRSAEAKGGGGLPMLPGNIKFSPPYVPVGSVGDLLKPIIRKPEL